MKKSCASGVATHKGPESRGAARERSVEALTVENAGRISFILALRAAWAFS